MAVASHCVADSCSVNCSSCKISAIDISRLAVDMDIHGDIHGYYGGTPAN